MDLVSLLRPSAYEVDIYKGKGVLLSLGQSVRSEETQRVGSLRCQPSSFARKELGPAVYFLVAMIGEMYSVIENRTRLSPMQRGRQRERVLIHIQSSYNLNTDFASSSSPLTTLVTPASRGVIWHLKGLGAARNPGE